MVKNIIDKKHLQQVQKKHKNFMMLIFWAEFSATAKHALAELREFSKENKNVPVYAINVEAVKGVHKQFGVANVPTVVALKKGKVLWQLEGVESAQLYNRILSGISSVSKSTGKKGTNHRVIVYSGPGCPACGTAKTYLRQRGIFFREIDISRDQHAAERLIQRSGQRAVPQIDIDGHLIVGFDKAKIDRIIST